MTWQLYSIFALAGIGLANTVYLSYHTITGRPVLCLFFPPAWCEKVQYSSYSKTFGVPNSFAGFCIYSALLVVSLLFALGGLPLWPMAMLIVAGFLFSMYFLGIQAFVLKAFCTWCVLSAIEFSLLLVILITLL